MVYNGELWLYRLKYGARVNLHGMWGVIMSFKDLLSQRNIIQTQYIHSKCCHSTRQPACASNVLSGNRLGILCYY